MFKRLILAAAVTLSLSSVAVAQQEQQCLPWNDAVKALDVQYGEFQHWQGLTNNGFLLTLFTNEKAGTWTLVVTRATDSLTCVVDAGDGWKDFDAPKPAGLAL